MFCEYCNLEHSGNYGSGRFCSKKCACGFSTKNNRKEIHRKVSETLTGRKYPNRKSILERKIERSYLNLVNCIMMKCYQWIFRDWEDELEKDFY